MVRPIFDSHLDLAWNALSWKRDITLPLDELNTIDARRDDSLARGRATTSLPELRRGGVMLCLGTLMARVPYGHAAGIFADILDFPSHALAWAHAQSQLAYYRMLAEQQEIQLIQTAAELGEYWHRLEPSPQHGYAHTPIGLIVAMEGADAIMQPSQVSRWFDAGLRCASLVHYGVSAYAHGTGSDGPLTAAGREMLAQFDQVGMILDVTHLSDTSFWEVLDLFGGPLIASHQNCRALVPAQRQFDDRQIKAVMDRGGVLGVAMDAWMLDPDWQRPNKEGHGSSNASVSLEDVANHIDHICQLAGSCQHVALGSDLDGGFGHEQTPHDLRTIADLQKLSDVLSRRGYSEQQIDSVFHGNYLRFFMEHLP